MIRLHQRFECDSSLFGRDLVYQVRVDLRVRDVRVEVVAAPADTRVLHVVIHPPEEYLLGRQSQQVLDSLAVLEESRQARAVLEGDLVEQADTDDLPEEAEHEVGRALGQVVRVDVDDVAADGLGRGEGERQVLVHPVQREVLLVDRALVDCVRTRVVDDFAGIIRMVY